MEIVTLPDPRLFQVSRGVEKIDGRIRNLAREMIDTMHRANGVGLAGVQVGAMERIFVVHVDGDSPRVFINPKLVSLSSELTVFEEGCLSVPGVYSNIDRPDALKIEAYNDAGEPFELEVDGFLARVIQHEYDHLEGRVFYQHLGERKQARFLRSYEKLHTLTL